jgi:hypothetical protein
MQPQDCDAPGVICDTFSNDTIPDLHPIVVQTAVKLAVGMAIDLDGHGALSADSPAAVIQLRDADGGLYLSGLHGSTLAEACDATWNGKKHLATVASLRVDGLGPRTLVCGLTARRQVVKIYLTSEVHPGDREIAVSIVKRKL